MDIGVKHVKVDANGVRIAELNEMSYRKLLWEHRPIADFWRVGSGYAKKLEKNNIFTMGDVARCSIKNEELLYKLFGINAELLIDHSWGYEPCTMKDVKNFKPSKNSLFDFIKVGGYFMSLTISKMQKYLEEKYKRTKPKELKNTQRYFLKLIEEVGELAEVIRKN